MLRFVLHKLISKKWLALCLLIGNILFVAVASSNPLYSDAVLQRALTNHLSATLSENNTHPAQINLYSSNINGDESRELYEQMLGKALAIPESLDIPVALTVRENIFNVSKAKLQGIRGDDRGISLTFSSLTDFKENIRIVSGANMADTVVDGVIEAVISQTTQRRGNHLVGDEYILQNNLQPNGQPYVLRIVGIYTAADNSGTYWDGRTSTLCTNIVISESAFDLLVGKHSVASSYTVFLDYTAVSPDHIDALISTLTGLAKECEALKSYKFTENLSSQLEAFIPEATQFNATLLVLYAPIFALLAAFVFMVSRQMMDLEENEIAVIVSRGSKKWQIILLYFLQAFIVSVSGALIGYPLGFGLCRMLGASNSFLEFVQRKALPLIVSWRSVGFACGAAAVSCAFMTMPVLRYANRSIVQYKVQKQAQNVTPLWKKLFLDVLLLGVSLYALYSFNNQKDFLSEQVLRGGSLDPLLYFSSSVFIVGAGLLAIRLIPYLITAIFKLGKRFWSPALYTANLQVIRTRNQQTFIMLFVILTIALGMFNATSARTINGNAENRIRYLNGADVVFQQNWQRDEDSGILLEPKYEKYTDIEGVTGVARVYRSNNGSIYRTKNSIYNISIMGINTKEFGETIEFDSSLLPIHINHYLNAMSQDASGILVSSNFQEEGFTLGSRISYRDDGGNSINGVIYGFVDYWPGYSPVRTELSSNGDIVETKNYLIIAHLSQLQIADGVKPYQLWINMDGSTQPIYDYFSGSEAYFLSFNDSAADIIALKNEPLFQGTNGILTANFIVVLVLCMAGFLIFWVLSIRSRELQFGIFRAMGLSMKEVITMLVVEQILITGSSIAVGIGIGVLVTKLYLPLIQIAYSSVDQVLPLVTISYWSDYVRLFGTIAVMVILCMAILAWLISKIRIAQALKLGED